MRAATRPIVHLPPNASGGRDFVFGDIHGCFSTVEHALEALAYDPDRDRLVSLGDLIDYGPRSADALEWMKKRFALTVRGNHEDMMLDWCILGSRLSNEGGAWRRHWAADWVTDEIEVDHGAAWRPVLKNLPYAATVELSDGCRVGLMHAFRPGWVHRVKDNEPEWSDVCEAIADPYSWSAHAAMWNRPDVRATTPDDPQLPHGVAGVDYLLHGHDPGPEPAWTARRTLCIDTGVHWPEPEYGHLTVAELRPTTPVLHRFARVDVLPADPTQARDADDAIPA